MKLPRGYHAGVDRCGIMAAGICLLHCALFPLVVYTAPTLSALVPNGEWLHMPLVFLATGVGVVALSSGFAHHRRAIPVSLGLVGIMLLLASLAESAVGEFSEPLASSGAVFMAAAHYLNLRTLRSA